MALAAALVAALCVSPALVAVAIGVLQTQERARCPQYWAVPALLLWVLFPSCTPAFLGLLPVLLWPIINGRVITSFPALGAVLAVSCLWHQGDPSAFLVTAVVGILIPILAFDAVIRASAPGDLSFLRPVLLLSIVIAARAEGLEASAQAAALGLFLDLVLLVLTPPAMKLVPEASYLRLPLPPLPGFIVLWLGIHAALGMAAGVQGWSVAGVGVAMLLGLLALLDFSSVQKRPGRGVLDLPAGTLLLTFSAAALLLPVAVVLLFSAAIHQIGGTLLLSVFSLGGGDGAHLRLPLLAALMMMVWLLLTRPWTPHGLARLQGIQWGQFPRSELLSFFGGKPIFPWELRRVLAGARRFFRNVRKLRGWKMPDGRRAGIGLWLFLLAVVLAVLGLTS